MAPYSLPQILGGFIAPAILVALIAGFAWKRPGDARWVFGPLIALAFVAAYVVVEPKIGWPPTANALYLPFYGVIAAGILTLADSLARPPFWLRIVVLVAFWQIIARLMLNRLIPSSLSVSTAEIWADISTLITAIWFVTLDHLADRAPGATAPLFLSAMCFAAAVVLALGWHIQNSGALAGATMLICLAGVAAALFNPRASFSRGFAQMVVIILQLLLLHGCFYTDDNLTELQQLWISLLLAAPLLTLLGDIPAFQAGRSGWRLLIRLGPAIILLAIVCAATARDFLQADQSAPAGQQ